MMESEKIIIDVSKQAYVKTIVKQLSAGDTAVLERIAVCLTECMDNHGLKMVWNIAHGHIVKQTIMPGQPVYVKPKLVCGWSYDLKDQESLLHNGYMKGFVTKVNMYSATPLLVSFEVLKKDGDKELIHKGLDIEEVNIENYG
jgi:hypothetical protein